MRNITASVCSCVHEKECIQILEQKFTVEYTLSENSRTLSGILRRIITSILQVKKQVKKQKKKDSKRPFSKSKIKEMASSGVYKLDDGKPYLNNCFPAKSLLRTPEEGQLKHHCVRKPSDLCTINVSGLKFSKAKEKDFKHVHSVIYINASENLLPLETFHTFPALKELGLAFNGIKTVCVKYGDFKLLEFLDLSFNSLTAEAIYDLEILPHLRVLLLTGNGLTFLPPNLAVTEQEASVSSLTNKRYILRFPALETLMLDDNKLSNPNCFASLAGLRRLKKLSLDQNRIFWIPYLQQVQLRDGLGDWVRGRASPRKEPQSMLQPRLWMCEASDDQPNYTVLPMKKDVDRTEVVFLSYPGFSTSETTKVCSLPPIFEILPVKSLKARNQTLAPPFPELRYLSLAYNKIAKEDALLPVALFPSLCELVFHNNPLVTHTRGVAPLLKSFLQERLGIHLIRRKVVKAKHRILIPQKESRKVKTQGPKVPKQPLLLHHPPLTTIRSPSWDLLEAEAGLAEELPPVRSTSLETHPHIKGPEGLNLSSKSFVPLPAISSDSTVHSEETTSHPGNTAGRLSPGPRSDEDTKSTEYIFLTQVSELPSSITCVGDLEVKEKDQRRLVTAPSKVKKTKRKLPSSSIPTKYHGYEELLTTRPDPAFVEPKGIQKNAQALQQMLKHPLIYHSSKPKLDSFQKHYVPKEKKVPRILVPPPPKTRAQLLDDTLIRMRDPHNITEAPLGSVLRQQAEPRLMNRKQYLEAKRLLKEFQERYRRLVRGSLRTVFGATPAPPALPAPSESPPKFGRFLELMDEFCQEPTSSDSKT
ncbi:X-ray radiation resistance-associated protein 1 [Heterocephalus glaber]|uniref:X-ray radiation resistance-associated protein 1 n=1 Tax=Heterocephalus glaber TaxID=10181 RepID=G5AS85_HETGA|nr:X-ray radiation resistance-associated protein 1 [Heterocephalus glaber]